MSKNPSAMRARKQQRRAEAEERQRQYAQLGDTEKLIGAGKKEREKILAKRAKIGTGP